MKVKVATKERDAEAPHPPPSFSAAAVDAAERKSLQSSDEKHMFDFEADVGGVPHDASPAVMERNTRSLTEYLRRSANHTTLLVPDKTFHFYPGIYGRHVRNFTLLVGGTVRFHRPPATETNHYGRPEPGLLLDDSRDVVISSPEPFAKRKDGRTEEEGRIDSRYDRHKRGVVDGHGADYWGIPFLSYLPLGEFRPDLLVMNRTSNALIEYVVFRDPGLYTLHLHDMENLKIRYISIVARRTDRPGHGNYDMSAFNTDGIDVSGNNVHVHDVDIYNQDDCIAVKDAPSGLSQNMLFERVNASGLGLTIGSIGGTAVRNITFRDSLLYKTSKGIYMKFRNDEWRDTPGLIEDVTYENIVLVEPEWWGLWIGPAQQSISGNMCHPSPCSLCWPMIPLTECFGKKGSQYKNIALKNIKIHHPLGSPGVILADESTPIEGLLFEDVLVTEYVPTFWQSIDVVATFPGLKEPIQDGYMHPLMKLLYSLSMIAAALLSVIFLALGIRSFWAWESPRRDGDAAAKEKDSQYLAKMEWNYRFFHRRKSLIAMFGVTAIVVTGWTTLRTRARTLDKSRYFICEGVVDGRATRGTWPVPPCLTDETGR